VAAGVLAASDVDAAVASGSGPAVDGVPSRAGYVGFRAVVPRLEGGFGPRVLPIAGTSVGRDDVTRRRQRRPAAITTRDSASIDDRDGNSAAARTMRGMTRSWVSVGQGAAAPWWTALRTPKRWGAEKSAGRREKTRACTQCIELTAVDRLHSDDRAGGAGSRAQAQRRRGGSNLPGT
jgi:hypothetical protein